MQSVEFNGKPDPDDPALPYIDVNVVVATRLPIDPQMVAISITVVPIV